MNATVRLLSGRSQVQLLPGTQVFINTFAQFLLNCDLPRKHFPKGFPKDSKNSYAEVLHFHTIPSNERVAESERYPSQARNWSFGGLRLNSRTLLSGSDCRQFSNFAVGSHRIRAMAAFSQILLKT